MGVVNFEEAKRNREYRNGVNETAKVVNGNDESKHWISVKQKQDAFENGDFAKGYAKAYMKMLSE